MQDRIEVLERNLLELQDANDKDEQNQHRLCLIVNGMELPSLGHMETADDCLTNVKSVTGKNCD